MTMFLHQYYLGCLSHTSYLIGDLDSGRAVVVDPQRDVSQYLADARSNGLTIERVIETHFHADFLSGHLELVEQVGATIVYGEAAAGRTEFDIETMADGTIIALGDPTTGVSLEILQTPGHTPESICIVVREHAGDATPHAVLTGDTLFIGDVGRPDLLAAAGSSADHLAQQLYHSLHGKLMTLPDQTKVYPAHGAGSACGKNLSTDTVSTIGEQRRTNYALQPMTEAAFVHTVTQGQAAAPLYFKFASTKNRQAHSALHEDEVIRSLTFDELVATQSDGAWVIDGRDAADFAAGHLRGSINVGMGGRFAEYAGEVVPAGAPIVLVTEPGHEHEAQIRLARIGFDTVVGALSDPLHSFIEHPDAIERASRLSATELATSLNEPGACVQLVDVRGPGEVAGGMIDGAIHVQLPQLLPRLGELDPTVPTVVYCAGGYRSSIAASALRANGFADVSDLLGGYGAWTTLSRP